MAIKKINRTFKFQLKPTKTIRDYFGQIVGSTRFIYNYMLNICKKETSYPGYTKLANMLPKMKKNPELAWLKEVPSQVLQQALKDLDRAFIKFFKEKKTLRFRKKEIHTSFR